MQSLKSKLEELGKLVTVKEGETKEIKGELKRESKGKLSVSQIIPK